MKKRFLSFLGSILRSNKFYFFILIFFIFEASWIALSAKYPQAFDENFHFGLIKLYSTHISPFLSSQPANGNPFGAVARDPSYLYHYLMSWPYRLIEIFIHTKIIQIVVLRFINILFFLVGLIYFRKFLLNLKLSRALSNVIILLFILIPIVPQLAGQINYDNMLFMLCGIIFWYSLRIINNISKKIISFKQISILMILCTFTSLVKYAFLPIYLAILIFFFYLVLRKYKNKFGKFLIDLLEDFKQQKILTKIVLIFLIVLSLFMFYQRDGINLVDYGSLTPNCQRVISVNQCKQYYVWASDTSRHKLVLEHKASASSNPFYYIGQWIYWMWYRLFFAINGPKQRYVNYPPLPLPSIAAILVSSIGLILLIKNYKKIFYKNDFNIFIMLIVLIYSVALFIQGVVTYQYTAVLENMNGRYLIPILILFIALLAQAYIIAFKNHSVAKILITFLVILMFIDGGGMLTYIVRSDDSWYITNSKVDKISKVAKKITKKIVITGKKTYSTKFWFFN